ncbi:MAG TPA: YciI family protein [Candidatus Cybelea sp.]
MTYYAVDLIPATADIPPKDVIVRHAAHLRELDEAGKLVLAGPFSDDPHGLLVLKVADKAEADGILDVDPLITSGVRTYRVHTWLIAGADNGYMP